MPKTAKNGKGLTANILELLYKLHEKVLLVSFESDLNRYSRSNGYKSIFKLFEQYIQSGKTLDELPSDSELAKVLKMEVENFAKKRQDFYNRILDYVGRELLTEEDWYKEALKVLSQVDGLWALGLRDHAEALFLNIYDLYPKQIDYETKFRYSYCLSKITYYAQHFITFGSFIGKLEEHKTFLQREEFQLIKELESAASLLAVSERRYTEPEKWQKDSAVFRMLEVLGIFAKQKRNFQGAQVFLRTQQDYLSDRAMKYGFSDYKAGNHIWDSMPDNDAVIADELFMAFTYYLTMEHFHLCILNGNQGAAEQVLQELHQMLNSTAYKSRNYMVGLILYLQLDLQQAQYGLALSGRTPELQIRGFESHFLAGQDEVENLEVRIEINKLILQYFSPDRPAINKLEEQIKIFDKKLRGVHAIKLELELLKLFIYLDNFRTDMIELCIRSILSSSRKTERSTELLKAFLHKVRKTNFINLRELKSEISLIAGELESLRNHKNHNDNLIMFWLYQFTSKKRPEGFKPMA